MGFMLNFQMTEIWLNIEESVCHMVQCHDKKDEEGFKKAFEEFKKHSQSYLIGEKMRDHNLEEWDWKWAAETGHLCNYDWILFGDEIIKAGVSKEEYDKKWKTSHVKE